MSMLDEFQQSIGISIVFSSSFQFQMKKKKITPLIISFENEIDGLCGEVESEAQRLLDLLVLPPRDAVGRELQGYDHRRERQHVQFFLRRVQDGQGRLQQAWSMERLRLRRIIEISTCEKDSQQVNQSNEFELSILKIICL